MTMIKWSCSCTCGLCSSAYLTKIMSPLNRISVPGFWGVKLLCVQGGGERKRERERENKKSSNSKGQLKMLTISNSSTGMQSWWSTWSTRVMDFDPSPLREPSLSHDAAPADESLDISDAMPPSTGAKGLCVCVCVCVIYKFQYTNKKLIIISKIRNAKLALHSLVPVLYIALGLYLECKMALKLWCHN